MTNGKNSAECTAPPSDTASDRRRGWCGLPPEIIRLINECILLDLGIKELTEAQANGETFH